LRLILLNFSKAEKVHDAPHLQALSGLGRQSKSPYKASLTTGSQLEIRKESSSFLSFLGGYGEFSLFFN